MSDKEAQDDELMALESIYEGNVFSLENENAKICGQFRAFPSVPRPFHIVARTRNEQSVERHLVEHLPPINLHFQLPSGYPSAAAPNFSLSCKWLNRDQIARLCKKLDEIWTDNAQQVVLFRWTNFLSTESLGFLDIDDQLDLCIVCPPKPKHLAEQSKANCVEANGNDPCRPEKDAASGTEVVQLASKNGQKSHPNGVRQKRPPRRLYHERFYAGTKNSRRGRNAACDASEASSDGRKPTQHRVRDRDPRRAGVGETNGGDPRAIQETRSHDQLLRVLLDNDQLRRQKEFEAQLFVCKVCFEEKVGSQCLAMKPCNHVFCKLCLKSYFNVQIESGSVRSLFCPEDKCASHALPTQVRELVNSELYAKYDRLLLTSTLDTMADIIYCPRINCQCPVLIETGSNMASCPSCFHVFCVFCKMAYHGIVPCRLRPGERMKIVNEYLNSSPVDKQAMEQRYGRQQMMQLIDNTLSEEWVHSNSKACPKCRANIEKLDGCNKMTCWKCDAYFCWLCTTVLSKGNPYEHYNATASLCQGLLFQGADLDDDDDSDNDFEDEFGRFLE